MANHQTLKRPVEEMSLPIDNDNLNNEEMDATWGGKRCRFLYNCTLELPESNKDSDSDDTETILSIQSKTTIEAFSETDSTDTCGEDCDCHFSQSDHTEFEVVSSSSSYCINDPNSSDSSVVLDYELPSNIVHDKSLSASDNGYLPDDVSDIQETIEKKKIPPPACFKFCVQCKKENENPFFQYCHTCFRYRMEFFVSKPKPKPRNFKRLKYEKKGNSLENQSGSLSMSRLNLSQIKNIKTININSSKAEKFENNHLCNICFILPKNGVFNHGKTGHIYCCYQCAKKIRKQTNKCPICNVKVDFVTRMITV